MKTSIVLTPDELAERWNVHKVTVLRLYQSGALGGIMLTKGKTRNTIRFRLSTVEAFEQEQESMRPEPRA
jgi:excisionase family DNA binding protein